MTMAAEIKNRVGPPAAAQPTAGQLSVEIQFSCIIGWIIHTLSTFHYPRLYLRLFTDVMQCVTFIFVTGVKISNTKAIDAKAGGGCC